MIKLTDFKMHCDLTCKSQFPKILCVEALNNKISYKVLQNFQPCFPLL